MQKLKFILAGFTLSLFASQAGAQVAGSIEQLSWMTGNWAGQLGPNQLEENWTNTDGSSLVAAVRMTGGGATSMFEMITIEEVDGSLVLHIQQWDPGFQPRTAEAAEMVLEEITDNSVKFRNTGTEGMPTLGYSHPDSETFIIHVGQANGNILDLPLKKRSIWE